MKKVEMEKGDLKVTVYESEVKGYEADGWKVVKSNKRGKK